MISESNDSSSPTSPGGARQLLSSICVVFVLGAIVELFLAGLGVFETERVATRSGSTLTRHAFDSNFDPHIVLGDVLAVVTIAVVLVALLGRLERRIKLMSASLLAVIAIQAALADSGPPALRALHPVLGVVALGLGVHLALATRAARSG